MIMQRGTFVGPLQGIKFGNTIVDQMTSTRLLGVETDSDLNWKNTQFRII